ncbi:MAG: EAL domain-containing protein [Actinomycetota bacterium]
MADVTWILVCAILVMLMQAGFLCLETGLTRSKNNINVALKNLTDLGISFVGFWAVGYGLAFGASWSGLWGGSMFWFDFAAAAPIDGAGFLYQALFCGTAVTIMSGAIAGRLRYGWYLGFVVVVGAWMYPVAIHWLWNADGWIARLGFVDFAGSTAVHSVGGWVALALVLVLGPRLGRFDEGSASSFSASNLPFATLGVLLLWVGWIGFNGGSLLRFGPEVVPIIGVTVMAGAAGLVVALVVSTALGASKVTDPMNGALSGLVAVTASAHVVSTAEAIVVAAGGALIGMVVERGMVRARVDDAVGAVPVHLGAGVWGTLAVAFVADGDELGTGNGFAAQLWAQVVGIGATAVWAFGLTMVMAWFVNRRWPLRVSAEAERIGLNVAEHGASSDLVELVRMLDEHADDVGAANTLPADPSSEAGALAAHYNQMAAALSQSEHVASVDPLTQLLNRRGFARSVEAFEDRPYTVAMFDVCRFGSVNGSYGHESGDEVLVQVSRHLQARLGPGWILARWGGDEFIAAAPPDIDFDLRVVEPVECRLSSGRPIAIAVRAGVVGAINTGGRHEEVFRKASYALDEAKRSGTSVRWFDDQLGAREQRSRALAAAIDGSLDDTQLVVVGQPIMRHGRTAGVELLIRWQEADGSLTGPAEILPVFVESGRMYDLDVHMLHQAARFAATLPDGPGRPWVSVNISPSSFANARFLDAVRHALETSAIDPAWLVVEITEEEPDGQSTDWRANAHGLRNLGVGLAIDDFGSGYSNIERMISLPITHLKFDRDLVLSAEGPLSTVVRSLTDICLEAGIVPIAEGVETANQAAAMQVMGIELFQGFYFARPQSLAEVTEHVVAPSVTDD